MPHPLLGRRLRRAFLPYALLLPAAAILFLVAVVTLYLARFSFNPWNPTSGMGSGWSLDQYVTFLTHPYYVGALLRTLRIAFTVTLINLVLGYVVAYVMATSPRYRNLLLFVVVAPLVIDVIVRVYGWIVLLSVNGPVNQAAVSLGILDRPTRLIATEGAVIAELVHETLAFMILPIASVLQKIDPALGEASRTLSAGCLRTFLHITLPLSLPGVLAGTTFVFALCIGAFSGPLLLGGGRVEMISLVISNQVGVTLNWPLGGAMSIVLVGLTLLLLIVYARTAAAFGRWSSVRS